MYGYELSIHYSVLWRIDVEWLRKSYSGSVYLPLKSSFGRAVGLANY